MNVEKKGKRFFITIMMVLMFILTVGTIIFAEEGGGSYSFTIQKLIANKDGIPEDVLKKAQNKDYIFRVEGITRDRDGKKTPVERKVKITGEGTITVGFDGPTEITAIELTDSGSIVSDGTEWNVSNIQHESNMFVPGRASTISISRDNGQIKIERPLKEQEIQADTYFRITGKAFKSENIIYENGPLKIGPGEEVILKNLKRGEYTVEEVKSEGFSVIAGPRTAEIAGGQKGEVYINGESGKLTITAPGALGGPEKYYYVVERDDKEYERDIVVNAGESYKMEHLPKGKYSVKEYLYSGNQEYTVTVPQTTYKDEKLVIVRYASGTKKNVDQYVKYYTIPKTVKYAKLKVELPYFTDGSIPRGTEGKVYVGGYFAGEPTINKGWGFTRTVGTSAGWMVEKYNMLPGSPVSVKFRSQDPVVDGARVTLRMYTERIKESGWKDITEQCSQTVDGRGWMTISKPQDSDVAAGEVVYYFTVTDKDGNPITGYTVTDANGGQLSGNAVTDKEGTSVMLKAGQTVTINGLAEGTYDVKETIRKDTPAGFRIVVEDDEKDVTSAKGSFEVNVLGERNLVINKWKSDNDDTERIYTFAVYKENEDNLIKKVSLKAGESNQEIMLETGKYIVKAIDDQDDGFSLTFRDSSTVQITSTSSASVVFSNTLTKVEGSYHIIHEYYFKNADGTYDYEGASEEYFYQDVALMPMYGGREYKPMQHGYGMVQKEGEETAVFARLSTPSNASPANSQRQDGRQEKASPSNVSLFDRLLRFSGGQQETATPGNAVSSHQTVRTFDEDEILDEDELLDEDEILDEDELFERRSREKADDLLANAVISGNGKMATDKDTGIVVGNTAEDVEKNSYTYQADEDMDHVVMTENGEQIIIMRYYRERQPEGGAYKVIHVYYFRGQDGDRWEGSSELDTITVNPLTLDEKKKPHMADEIDKIYNPQNFSVDEKKYQYTYDYAVYGKVEKSGSQGNYTGEGNAGNGWVYKADTKMKAAYATEDGDQIIILRYYRGVTPDEASYNVVHEYYYREKGEVVGDEQVDSDDGAGYSAGGSIPLLLNDNAPDDGGVLSDSVDGEESFDGTLTENDDYVYTFEGMTDIENIPAPKENHYTKENVEEKKTHVPEGSDKTYSYTYYDVGYGRKEGDGYVCIKDKQWAAALESGEEIIILRYIREENPNDNPPEPDKPHRPGGGGGGGKDPGPTPNPSPTPDPTPEPPAEPETPSPGLPDPNDPTSPERITVVENGVPKTYLKVWNPETQEFVYMLEDEVPLAWMNQLPKTGEEGNRLLWMILMAVSLGGGIVAEYPYFHKKE